MEEESHEMEDQGLPILVCRYGREVAVLTPVEGRRRVPREAFEPIELSSFQAGLLRNIAAISPRTLADPGSGCAYERPSDVMVALARMELAGLVEKGVGGWRATGAGVRQVAALDRITPL